MHVPKSLLALFVGSALSFGAAHTGTHTEILGYTFQNLALVFKLNVGKTAEDVTTWMTSFAGPPPVDPGSGTILPTATAGETFYTPVTLTPGSYVAVCPLPNLASGTPHFADGMVDTFTVE